MKFNRDYSQVFETTAQTEANKRYRAKFRDKVRQACKRYNQAHPPKPRTPEQQEKFNIWQRKRNLQKFPLQQRSWWHSLPAEHKELFLTEFDPEKQTIKEFKSYLSQLPKERLSNTGNTLTEDQVREIKQALKAGVDGVPENRVSRYLANKYGVTRQTISHIRIGRSWKNV